MTSPEVQALLDKARENVRAAEALLLAHRNQSFSSHSALISAFGREFAKTRLLDPRFHGYLIAAQELRQSGDYEVSVSVPTNEIEQALQWAQEFIIAAETFLIQT